MKNHPSLFLPIILALCMAPAGMSLGQKSPDKEQFKYLQSRESQKTNHKITIDGKKISYEATAGFVTLKKNESHPIGSIFYIAYTRNDIKNKSTRPLAFVFNGGPGSSSVWLHMGMLGPRRVRMSDDGTEIFQPFGYNRNEYSFLDQADLVFIDPMSTGYSRPIKPGNLSDFHGVEEDIQTIGNFIHEYIKQEYRWISPKYLIGESYGTFRSAGLSQYLQDRHGIYLKGLILISTVLNFQTILFNEGNDLPYITFLPGYAAAAWYHKKIDENLQSLKLQSVLEKAEAFAIGEYASALIKGTSLPLKKFEEVARRLSEFCGLPQELVKQNHLRIKGSSFYRELLRDQDLVIGRNDCRLTRTNHVRFTGVLDEIFFYDPSYTIVQGAFTAVFNDYLQKELKFKKDLIYEIFNGRLTSWNSGEFEGSYYNKTTSIHRAMIKNPALKVFMACGYYDLASPYFVSKFTLNHLFIHKKLRKNILLEVYQGGHMMYTVKNTLRLLKKDINRFFDLGK
jgi:carboxypeptidase C (cathepsin A)